MTVNDPEAFVLVGFNASHVVGIGNAVLSQ